MNSPVYSFHEKQLFCNKSPFPNSLRMVIIGCSGVGKSKLLFKLLLEGYLNFSKIIFCSPSLSQVEYQVITKGLQKGLNISQIRTLFEVQKYITDIDTALDMISQNKNFKPSKLEVEIYNHPDLLPLPN